MSNFIALVRRELGVYFGSPMAYIILASLLLLSGWFFLGSVSHVVAQSQPMNYQVTLWTLLVIVVITSALVTMRLIAEEKSRGTLEIVMTAPITEMQFVAAKFASAMLLLVYLVLPTLGFAILIAPYGALDWGAVFCGYLGILVVGAVAYSIGLFISSLCNSQITAGVITFVVAIFLLIVGILASVLPKGTWVRPYLELLDFSVTFQDYLKGVVDLGRLVFALSIVVFFLFLTTRVVESRRWR